MRMSFLSLVMFSSMILLKIWSTLMTWDSSPSMPVIQRVFFFIVSHRFPICSFPVFACLFVSSSHFLLIWSRFSTLPLNPEILSSASLLLCVNLSSGFLVGLLTFSIPASFQLEFSSVIRSPYRIPFSSPRLSLSLPSGLCLCFL